MESFYQKWLANNKKENNRAKAENQALLSNRVISTTTQSTSTGETIENQHQTGNDL